MITLHLILMILAIICFALTAVGVQAPPRVNLLGAGLFLWALATIISV
jgi:hypothetical protein